MAAYNRLADNYYNENDEKAAAWLRELIRRGLIAPGEVDTRSIVDVRPDDLAWLDHVWTDMEGAGYAFGAKDLCAAGFGAPHIRQRQFLCGTRALVDPFGARLERHGRHGDDRGQPGRVGAIARGSVAEVGADGGLSLPDDPFWRANLTRGDIDDGSDAGRQEGPGDARTRGTGGRMANAPDGHGWRGERGEEEGTGEDEVGRRGPSGRRDDGRMANGQGGGRGEERQDGRGGLVGDRAQGLTTGSSSSSSSDGMADDDDGCGSRTLAGLHDAKYHPESRGSDLRRPGPTNGHWGDVDWLLCRDGKWRPVEPGTFPLAHGSAARVGRLRGYGNAIVAPAAQAFIEAYLESVDDRRVQLGVFG